MKWSKNDWGALLIGIGILFMISSIPFAAQLMSTIQVNVGGAAMTVTEVPPFSAMSFAVGFVFIVIGALIRFKF